MPSNIIIALELKRSLSAEIGSYINNDIDAPHPLPRKKKRKKRKRERDRRQHAIEKLHLFDALFNVVRGVYLFLPK